MVAELILCTRPAWDFFKLGVGTGAIAGIILTIIFLKVIQKIRERK